MRWVLCGLCFVLFMVSCSGSQAGVVDTAVPSSQATSNALSTAIVASAEPPIDLAALQNDLQEAESRWQSQNIVRYSINVSYGQPHISTQKLSLTVENGQVVDSKHTCYPQTNCTLQQIDPQEYTVKNLFNAAHNVIALGEVEDMTFNQTYGYPNAIIYEDAFWTTDSFQVLDP